MPGHSCLICRLDEGFGVSRVLLDASRDRKDVGVEDDVLRRKAGLLDQELVCAAADRHLALNGVRLADLVEGHHHHRSAVFAHLPGLLEEGLFASLEADRVADTFALQAFEARLEDRPLRAVDHDGKTGDLGFGGDQVEEAHHRLLGVEQVGVHVHVDEVCPAAHLLERDLHRTREIA